MKRLTDYKAAYNPGSNILRMDCPGCGQRLHVGVVNGWTITGTFPDLTVTPSIRHVDETKPKGTCWHGWVTEGEVQSVSEREIPVVRR